jgi:hypothetical protein
MTKYFLILIFSIVYIANVISSPIPTKSGEDDKVFVVSMLEFKSDVQISIFNEVGVEVFTLNHVNESSKTKAFDVNALPTGNYVLVITDELREKSTPFEVKSNEVEFYPDLTSLKYKPSIQQIGSRAYINARLSASEKVEVSITNDKNVELFSETYEVESTFGKILNFQDLLNGSYVVRISMEDKLYTKEILIK